MGATTKRDRKTYYSISGGQIRLRVTQDEASEDNVIKRETAKGETVYERTFTEISGTIQSVEVFDHSEFGEFLQINMSDGVNDFTLSISVNSPYATRFLTIIPNVDLSKPVEIVPYEFTDKERGKDVRTLNIFQGERFQEKVAPYFTKDNPNGMPQADWDEINKKGKLDKERKKEIKRFMEDLSDWLVDYMKTNIKFQEKSDAAGNAPIEEKKKGQPEASEVDDDLPF